MLSSPTLFHSFSPSFYLRFVIQDLKKMFFIWCMLSFFILMALVGIRHDNVHSEEEEDVHSDPFFEDEGGDGGIEGESEDTNKPDLTPFWKHVTKLGEGRRGGG
jgi:hypothetical protein